MTSILQKLSRPFTSSTLNFAPGASAPKPAYPENHKLATVAGGCFWGLEHIYKKNFDIADGLYGATVGFIGGHTEDPTYQQVCSRNTGHAEALQIAYNPDVLTYRTLIEFFYKIHDPTTLNRQGGDTGTQYRSGIYYHDEEQRQIAEDVTKKANEQWWHGKIVTEIKPAGPWYVAEEYHQRYLENNPGGYECPLHYVRKLPPLK